ncbi:hypothetical protein ACFFV7_03745 [Nonomuraea spiralis]|uniref:Uncharacterized protein n=1 Tax=Nonomuraea spiralis TaxID=46182 RepID=A0ABV5I760_9ACTN|nr:hypothetical protein [Nonomuraea spiralis]GGS67276.1 hypothetical protein GCM10010176_007500 [Nonomuraea spiralis]
MELRGPQDPYGERAGQEEFLVHLLGGEEHEAARSVEPVQINGGPGLLVRIDGEIDGVVAVRVENGYVTGAYHVRDPGKLSRVERETAVTR